MNRCKFIGDKLFAQIKSSIFRIKEKLEDCILRDSDHRVASISSKMIGARYALLFATLIGFLPSHRGCMTTIPVRDITDRITEGTTEVTIWLHIVLRQSRLPDFIRLSISHLVTTFSEPKFLRLTDRARTAGYFSFARSPSRFTVLHVLM